MKKRTAICNATGSAPLAKPTKRGLARPEKIIAFTRCKTFIKQNRNHCKMPCNLITLFPAGDIGDIHEATKKIVHFYFYETGINGFEQAISSAVGMFSHPQDRNKKQSKLLPRHDHYTDEDFDAFIDSIKKEATKRFSEIILNKRPDDQSKVQVINAGMNHLHILFLEIKDAIKSKKSHYAAELMFHAGRLLERALSTAYEQYTITGIKNRIHLEDEKQVRTDEKKKKANECQEIINRYVQRNPGQSENTILKATIKEYKKMNTIDLARKNPGQSEDAILKAKACKRKSRISLPLLKEYKKEGLITIKRHIPSPSGSQ